MRLRVHHTTTYRYDPPAIGIIQVLRLTPGNHDGQYVADWQVDLSTDSRLSMRRDAFGNNALTAAIFGPSPAVMRVLLDRGADPHATNNYGTSPADTVARTARQDYKDIFAAAGA